MNSLKCYKVKLNEKKYTEILEKFSNLFKFLHRNKSNDKYAILLPDLQTKNTTNKINIGNTLNIYLEANNLLDKKLQKFLFSNNYVYLNFSTEEGTPYGYSVRRSNHKKTTFSYIKNFIEKIANEKINVNNKLLNNEINKTIFMFYEKYGNKPLEIYNELKKLSFKGKFNKYPYIIYDSISLGKKGIYNNTIFEFDTIKLKEPKIVVKTANDLKYFNNFGLLKHEYKQKQIALVDIN